MAEFVEPGRSPTRIFNFAAVVRTTTAAAVLDKTWLWHGRVWAISPGRFKNERRQPYERHHLPCRHELEIGKIRTPSSGCPPPLPIARQKSHDGNPENKKRNVYPRGKGDLASFLSYFLRINTMRCNYWQSFFNVCQFLSKKIKTPCRLKRIALAIGFIRYAESHSCLRLGLRLESLLISMFFYRQLFDQYAHYTSNVRM